MLETLSVRRGFATNSSSSHSLIFHSNAKDEKCRDNYFGWQFFTAASLKRKALYLALILEHSLYRSTEESTWHNENLTSIVNPIVKSWTGVDLDKEKERDDFIGVDHQSCWNLPNAFGSKYVDKAFFDDLKNFVLEDDLVILGGNDNDDKNHPLFDKTAFQLPLFYENGSVCRKDSNQNYWTIFNTKTGDKVRFRFVKGGFVTEEDQNYHFVSDSSEQLPPVEKATAPELVDLTITNYCSNECKYCYRGCTSKGEHAEDDHITHIIDALRELKCFEIALGGGEPTSHPKFASIVTRIRKEGIVPNFTTKSLTWLRDERIRNIVAKNCGAWAYSVEEPCDVFSLNKALDECPFPKEKVTLNLTMGTVDRSNFFRILAHAWADRYRVTLLGFKPSGRGKKFKKKPYGWWLKVIDDMQKDGICPDISIDTCLAADYQAELDKRGISRYCYEIKDGRYSAYIDAVAKTIAPSSYCDQLKNSHELTMIDSWGSDLAGEIKTIYNDDSFLDT